MLDLPAWRATSAEDGNLPLQVCAAICRQIDGDIMERMYDMIKRQVQVCTAPGDRWLLITIVAVLCASWSLKIEEVCEGASEGHKC